MFEPFAKISRLSRPIIITEKLDGSNGQLNIQSHAEYEAENDELYGKGNAGDEPGIITRDFIIRVGSRKRWLGPAKKEDHFGFFKWAHENCDELVTLGSGRHYGEWWGQGIQRKYGLDEKRFSLFNTHRWNAETKPECCHVVPIIATGPHFDTLVISHALNILSSEGSHAAPGFMYPEGVVIYHAHGNVLMKKTFKGDEEYVPGKQRTDG